MRHLPTIFGRTPGRSFAAAAVAVGLLSACGAGDVSTDAGASPPPDALDDQTGRDTVVVQARDNTFLAQHVEVSAGTEVTFDNRGRNPHNVVPVEDGAFRSAETDDFQPGDVVSVVFDEPGEYRYYCSLHGTETAGMVGTVVVDG